MEYPPIGIIGLGYLGMEILRQFAMEKFSWAISNQPCPDQHMVPAVFFDWRDQESWSNIPKHRVHLLLTIPPQLTDPDAEKKRVIIWCRWMREYRPKISHLIYISTTGVYPRLDGVWQENMRIKPDTGKGKQRLATEHALSDFFDLTVIRSGAIYGPNRHIGLKLEQNIPIPKGDQPIHRIQVSDLAALVMRAASDPLFPKLVNAVDNDASSTETAAEWLLTQSFFSKTGDRSIQFRDGFHSCKNLKPCKNRKISNQLLTESYQYRFQYPTFREGLRQAIKHSN